MLTTTVLIVGAGPVGLWLAYDIKRMNSSLDVLVIDSPYNRKKRNRLSKTLTISAGTLETFESRGIANPFLENSTRVVEIHCAGTPIFLNEEVLGTRHAFNTTLSQVRAEEILLSLCEDIGVSFEWGFELVHLTQDEAGVAAIAVRKVNEHELGRGNEVNIGAQWIVGCDSCQSKVRELAGIDFEDTSSTLTSTLADIQASGPAGIGSTSAGPLTLNLAMNGGETSHDSSTLEECRESLPDTSGSNFDENSPSWSSRLGNTGRAVPRFRAGRILLAGDAGHELHPTGGQDLDLGIQDATSLAWRLAMLADRNFANKSAAEQILESYSRERCQAAKGAIKDAQAQMALLTAMTPAEIALREDFSDSLKNPIINERWARRLTGFGDAKDGYAYDFPRIASASTRSLENPLIGTRVTSAYGTKDLYLAANSASLTFLWVTAGGISIRTRAAFEDVVKTWSDNVSELYMPAGSLRRRNIVALLIRPDMRIAWAAKGEISMSTQRSDLIWVLQHWFGIREIKYSETNATLEDGISSACRLKRGLKSRAGGREWSIEGRSLTEIV